MKIRLNPVYQEAKETDERYRVLYGGAGSGKSYYVAQELILKHLEEPNHKTLVVRKVGNTLRNSVFALLEDVIRETGLSKLFRIKKTDMSIECINGNKIIMTGLDDVEKLKSIAGITDIWIEEASEITQQDFEQLDLRLRGETKHKKQITLTFNPISNLSWLKGYFFDRKPDNVFTLKTTYKDNLFIDSDYKQAIEKLKTTDYQYYRIYALGEWGEIGNVIFNNYKVEEFDTSPFDNRLYGIDWGFADDPFAFIEINLDKKRKKIHVLSERYLYGHSNEQAYQEIKGTIGNAIATADSAEPKSISEMREYGLKIKAAKKGKGSVNTGLRWLQSYEIIIHRSCQNFINEISKYKWQEDKDGNVLPKPVDKDNHLMDALRYAVESEIVTSKWGW